MYITQTKFRQIMLSKKPVGIRVISRPERTLEFTFLEIIVNSTCSEFTTTTNLSFDDSQKTDAYYYFEKINFESP